MKKSALLLAILMLITVFTGCGGGGGGSKDSAKVSGNATLTPEITGLLKALANAFIKEDAVAFANCMDFPFTLQNDYNDMKKTYTSYDALVADFEFSDDDDIIDIQKYYISNANFQNNGDGTGLVTYDAYIYVKIPDYGSGAENDEIELEVKIVEGQWKATKYHVLTAALASGFKSLPKSLNPSIFGSVAAVNE